MNIFVGISYFSASMLESKENESNGGKSFFTESIYQQIKKLAKEIKPFVRDETHIYALHMAVTRLKDLVGKNATQVYNILERESGDAL